MTNTYRYTDGKGVYFEAEVHGCILTSRKLHTLKALLAQIEQPANKYGGYVDQKWPGAEIVLDFDGKV